MAGAPAVEGGRLGFLLEEKKKKKEMRRREKKEKKRNRKRERKERECDGDGMWPTWRGVGCWVVGRRERKEKKRQDWKKIIIL